MPKVLLGQDGGDGLGHAARLAPIAVGLREHGHEVFLALRAPQTARALLEPLGLTAFPAPLKRLPPRVDLDDRRISSYADLLVRYSLDQEPWLLALTRAWDEVLDRLRPDLAVADFAPVLALAARGRLPVVHVGSGYTLPPATGPHFPKLRVLPDWVPEDELLGTVNAVQRQRQRPPLHRLTELLQGNATFVTCLSLLDPYRATREAPALGPLRPLPSPATAPPEIDCFAYLAADYVGTATLLDGLEASGRSSQVYLRNADAALRDHWRDRGLIVHDAPQPVAAVAGRAALVLHHGGINTTETVLALGRPQLFAPRHVEQSLNGRMAMALGAGVMMRTRGRFRVEHVTAALAAAVAAQRIEAAAATAERIAAAAPHRGLERITAACLDLLSGG
jgi:UDP:flavonoid glycosyltransferase YjiC (YdhE family)